jgi:transcriptional regulator with XRE-family HTH domain
MSFAETLQRLRKEAGLSQSELALRSGMSLDSLRNWEQGRTLPKIDVAMRLAHALGVDCTAFMDAEDVAAKPEPKKPARRKRKGE